jgi:peptidoglycan/xylan/chitin deacetylase (PgdA/CDA1 family)
MGIGARGARGRPPGGRVALVLALGLALAACARHGGGGPPAAVTRDPAGCPSGTVALTFDDGPDAHTAAIVDVLRAQQAKATFFVIGEKAAARRDLIAGELAAGARVENHSYTHPHLPTLPLGEVRQQLTRTSQAIVAAGGPRPTLFRPPYGESNPAIQRLAASLGLRQVTWTVPLDTHDWQGRSADEIRQTVLGNLRPGGVTLMHDGLPTATNLARALPAIIAGLRARGYCTGYVPAGAPSSFDPATG